MEFDKFSAVTRDLASHRDAEKVDSATRLELSPENRALLESNEQTLEALKAKEAAKRQSLAHLTDQRDRILIRALDLLDRLSSKRSKMKNQEKILSAQAGQLLQGLKMEESRVTTLSSCSSRMSKQRKHLLSRISEPGWAIPHHYHMTSIEHAMGHSQPHVLDVGSMIRGHLRIFAMANATVRVQKKVGHILNKAKTARAKVSEQIKQVYRQLRFKRAEIKEASEIIQKLSQKLGTPKQQARLREVLAKSRSGPERRFGQPKLGNSQDGLSSMASRNVLSQMPRRLPSNPKLTLDDDEKFTPRNRSDSNSSTSSKSGAVTDILTITPMIDVKRDSDEETSPRASPRVSPRAGGRKNLKIQTSRSSGKRPSLNRPGTPMHRPSAPNVYRNLKMKFFQALNLTPPNLHSMVAPSTNPANTSPQSIVDNANKTAATPSPADELAEDWRELRRILDELEPLDAAKQSAWEELESVLDHREKILYEVEKVKRSVERTTPKSPTNTAERKNGR